MEHSVRLQERQLERQQVMLEKVQLLALQSEESGGGIMGWNTSESYKEVFRSCMKNRGHTVLN